MWTATSNGHQILLAAHIDDFIIACVHHPTLDNFRNALFARLDDATDDASSAPMAFGSLSLSRLFFPRIPVFPKTIVILHLSACFTCATEALWEVWATSST